MDNLKIVNQGGIIGADAGEKNNDIEGMNEMMKIIDNHPSNKNKEEQLEAHLFSLRLRMERFITNEDIIDFTAGDFLKELLDLLEIDYNSFSKYINYEQLDFEATLLGKRRFDLDLAFKLGKIFSMDPAIWLLIQSKNDALRYKLSLIHI